MTFTPAARAYTRTKSDDQTLMARAPQRLAPAWQAAINELKKSLEI
jgi:hypothetical protein